MTMENQPKATGGRRRLRVAVPAVAIVGALAMGGYAWAQETPEPSDSPNTSSQPDARGNGFRGGPGHGGPGGSGGMMAGSLHGEFTVAEDDGGYQTIFMQRGEATAVDNDSITVKSEDGYEQTYAVDENTLVNSQREGIESIEKGDDVRVMATGDEDDPTATRVVDASAQQEMRERMGWPGRGPAGPNGLAG